MPESTLANLEITSSQADPVGIGLLGCGVVGTGVARILHDKRHELAKRIGRPLQLMGTAVRDLSRSREGLDAALLTADASALAVHPQVHIVVEVMGGVQPALDLILAAIGAGKHVVTANKEVIARHGEHIFSAARQNGVGVYVEGTVAGGIPLLMPLKRSLAANTLSALYGIVNGTTNYILTRMSEEGAPFEVVLAEAQALGYAEADPASDVEGFDAAYKAAILASLLSGKRVPLEAVAREGISGLTPTDLHYARELGYAVKLLAIARRAGDRLEVRVHPAMIPASHPLASIRLVTNAIAIKGDAVGEVMFSGPGAGQLPTASAVVSDILDAAEHLVAPSALMGWSEAGEAAVVPLAETTSRFYLRLLAEDRAGVMGEVGTRFGKYGVSIRYFVQREAAGGLAEMVFVTHPVREGALREAIAEISASGAIRRIESVVRVEEDV